MAHQSVQRAAIIRDNADRKGTQGSIKLLLKDKTRGIRLDQLYIFPALAFYSFSCSIQHGISVIDSDQPSRRADFFKDQREVPSRSASDIKNSLARAQVKTTDC